MKKILTIIVLMSFSWAELFSQNAKDVLDKTSQMLEKNMTAQARFHITTFNGNDELGSSKGEIQIKGRKIHLTSSEMETWFDGTTQWTMLNSADNEVNIQEPSEEEQTRMNPYAFIALYRKGYKLRLTSAELRGKQTFEITLDTKKKGEALKQAIVNIDKNTYKPLCLRLKHDKDWVRIAIYDLELGMTLDDSLFFFPTDKYPNTTIIDLR